MGRGRAEKGNGAETCAAMPLSQQRMTWIAATQTLRFSGSWYSESSPLVSTTASASPLSLRISASMYFSLGARKPTNASAKVNTRWRSKKSIKTLQHNIGHAPELPTTDKISCYIAHTSELQQLTPHRSSARMPKSPKKQLSAALFLSPHPAKKCGVQLRLVWMNLITTQHNTHRHTNTHTNTHTYTHTQTYTHKHT